MYRQNTDFSEFYIFFTLFSVMPAHRYGQPSVPETWNPLSDRWHYFCGIVVTKFPILANFRVKGPLNATQSYSNTWVASLPIFRNTEFVVKIFIQKSHLNVFVFRPFFLDFLNELFLFRLLFLFFFICMRSFCSFSSSG